MPSQLGYWAIRGLAQPIRLLLEYVGEDYQDVLYELGDGPEFSREAWYSVKNSLGLDFPNLPYYIDGDLKLTQSTAILRYLARKYKLDGDTEEKQAHVDMLLEEISDIRTGFVHLCYGPDFDEKAREKYVEEVKPKLEALEKYLGDKKFFAGDQVTVCDFGLYELLDIHKIFEPSLLDEKAKLSEYLERVQDLPPIRAYINSEKFICHPINNKCAQFV